MLKQNFHRMSAVFIVLLLVLFMGTGAAECNVLRTGGVDRYETAVLLAEEKFTSANTVILALGESSGNFADGLAASVLSGALNAPILLTRTGSIPQTVLASINKLGATQVIVLGGEKAILKGVVTELESHGLSVTRIAGKNRYETAFEVAKEAKKVSEIADYAFIVNGSATADALVAGAAAFAKRAPVLQVTKDTVPFVTKDALKELGIKRVFIVGGTSVISEAVTDQLAELVTVEKRFAGTDRYATGVELAKVIFPGEENVVLTSGLDGNLADAVVSSIFGRVILYVQKGSIPKVVSDHLESVITGNSKILITGGVAAVSLDVQTLIQERLNKSVGGTTNFGSSGSSPSTTIMVSSISVSPTIMNLGAGGATGTITATVQPANATNKNITWSSSNGTVASVNNGVVTPLTAGIAIITATSAADSTKSAIVTVTVTAPEPRPFEPGQGGSIIAPSFVSEPGKIGGLYVMKSHIVDESWELVLKFQPYGDYPDGELILQYSADGGDTWEEAAGFIQWESYNMFWLQPDAAYEYRLADVQNEYISNTVEVPLPNVSATACFEYLYIYENGIENIDPPYVGSGLRAYPWVHMRDDLTGDLNYQWYRVNPVTFEMTLIEGATGWYYTRAEADAGYLLLVRASLDGNNSGVFAQSNYEDYWPTIIPNKAYVTNLTPDGFTLNLCKSVDGIDPEDLSLFDYRSGDYIPILSVTQGQNKAIYHITAQIPENSNLLYLENFSDIWWIVTEWEEWIEKGFNISRTATIDISDYVNGGTVEGSEMEGFTIYTIPGEEKVIIVAGADRDLTYSFTVTNSAQGTVKTFEIYWDWDYKWFVNPLSTELDLSTQIGTGSAVQLQGVSGFTLNSGAKYVSINETQDVRDRKFYFNVSGGANNGKRYKVFYSGFWQAEEVAALITAIEIVGPDTIEIKRYEYSTSTTYTAVVKDQNGDPIADETVTWSIKNSPWWMGVGVNTGIVTLPKFTTEYFASIVLVATSTTDNTVKVEKTINLTIEARRENTITATSVGVLSNGNIDAVPAGTKVSALKAGLTVAAGATVEILTESGGTLVPDQETTDVTADMMIEVTAENGDKAEYTITMATYAIDVVNYSSQSLINQTLVFNCGPYGLDPSYSWNSVLGGPVYVKRTGTGVITNLTVTTSEKFGVWLDHPWQAPGGWTGTIDQYTPLFYVYAIEGLGPGTHTGTVRLTADHGIDVSFNVSFLVAN